MAAFAVVVERVALVIESLVALKEERRAVAEKYLVGETQTSLGLFFFFNGIVAIGLVKAYRLPRRSSKLAELLKRPTLSFGPFRHTFKTIFGMIGRSVAVGIAQAGRQDAIVTLEMFILMHPFEFGI